MTCATSSVCSGQMWWGVYIRRSDVTVFRGHVTISMLWGTRRTVWNWVVSIGRVIRIKLNQLVQRNVLIITVFLRKWRQNKQTFIRVCPTSWRKTAGIDIIWRNYLTVTLCICVVAATAWNSSEAPICRHTRVTCNYHNFSHVSDLTQDDCQPTTLGCRGSRSIDKPP